MTATRSGDGDFTGIDPVAMGSLVSAMSHAIETLNDGVAQFRLQLGNLGVDTSPLSQIEQIANWAGDQNLMLSRRHQLAVALAGHGPGLRGSRAASENVFLSKAQAKAKGAWLAERFIANESSGHYSWVLAELAKYEYDPEVTAAFFAHLGPAQTLNLPNLIGYYTSDHADPDAAQIKEMTAISRAFGSAVTGGGGIPGFAAVRNALTKQTGDPATAAETAALIAHAGLPPAYLAAVVKANLPGATIEMQDDTPRDVGVFLSALAANPAAARIVFTGEPASQSAVPRAQLNWDPGQLPMGGLHFEPTQAPSTAQIIKYFDQLVGQSDSPQLAADLGKAYAAAAGADDETDGQHSQAAASFARVLITTLPNSPWYSDAASLPSDDSGGMPEAIKPYLAKIAGSYAAEFTVAARGFGLPAPPHAGIPGLTAQFQMPPKDVYEYLKTFADTDANMAPFNAAMGQLSQRLLGEGATITQTTGANGMIPVAQALGNIAGLQLAAETSVRGQADAIDARNAASDKELADALSAAGGAILDGGPLWDAVLYAFTLAYNPGGGPTRISQLDHADQLAMLGAPAEIARVMLSAGYRRGYTTPPGRQLTDSHGDLLPINQIASDPAKLQDLYAWLYDNGYTSSDLLTFGNLAFGTADTMLGAGDQAQLKAQRAWG